MLGTIVNVSCIAAGSVIGSVFKKGIKEQHQEALFNAMGLAALGLGINGVQDIPMLWQYLEDCGYDRKLLEKLFWNNWLKLF